MLLFASACKKIKAPENLEIVDRDYWLDAIAVTKQNVLSVAGNTITFELELAAMQNAELTTIYPDASFHPDTVNGVIFTPVSIQRVELNEQRSFQTVLLVDASTDDWVYVDDGGFIDAINRLKKLTQSSGGSQTFGVGFFARDVYTGNAPVNFFRNSEGSLFDHTHQELMQFLSHNYAHLNDATASSLYDAIDKAADELIAHPLSSNQSITVIMGNPDDGQSNATFNTILTKCKNNNIAVNMILQSVWSYNYYRLAHETGGFISDNNGTAFYSSFPYNTSATVLFHVYELLARNDERYIVTCTATKSTAWVSNAVVRGFITAFYYAETGGDFLSSDLDINQWLPIYFNVP